MGIDDDETVAMKKLGELEAHIKKLDKPLDIPLNPNIVFTVEYLNRQGFRTTDSGDGKTHSCECDRDYPYVSMRVPSHKLLLEADRLYELLRAIGIEVKTIWGDGGDPGPCIQATYDPADGTGIIDLTHVDDDHFRQIGFCE